MTSGFNIAPPEAEPKRVLFFAVRDERGQWHPPLSNNEVNSSLAELYRAQPELALKLATEWSRK